ncbi:uncharacterized protein ACA1_353770, partial [Acanthamoeba castellanii str. Neff]
MNAAQDGDIIDLPAPTYNMVGSPNIQHSFTLRAGPAGVEFQGGWGWTVSNGTLTLDGSFRFNNTKVIRVNSNAAVNALGDLAMLSVGGSTMLHLEGLWHSHGTLSISVNNPGSNRGTWKQNGVVTAYATNTSQAIKLTLSGVWEQMGPVNIHLAQGSTGVLAMRDQHTTWRQQNSVLIAAAADSHYDTGVLMAGASPGGGWMQGGELTIRAAR